MGWGWGADGGRTVGGVRGGCDGMGRLWWDGKVVVGWGGDGGMGGEVTVEWVGR